MLERAGESERVRPVSTSMLVAQPWVQQPWVQQPWVSRARGPAELLMETLGVGPWLRTSHQGRCIKALYIGAIRLADPFHRHLTDREGGFASPGDRLAVAFDGLGGLPYKPARL